MCRWGFSGSCRFVAALFPCVQLLLAFRLQLRCVFLGGVATALGCHRSGCTLKAVEGRRFSKLFDRLQQWRFGACLPFLWFCRCWCSRCCTFPRRLIFNCLRMTRHGASVLRAAVGSCSARLSGFRARPVASDLMYDVQKQSEQHIAKVDAGRFLWHCLGFVGCMLVGLRRHRSQLRCSCQGRVGMRAFAVLLLVAFLRGRRTFPRFVKPCQAQRFDLVRSCRHCRAVLADCCLVPVLFRALQLAFRCEMQHGWWAVVLHVAAFVC